MDTDSRIRELAYLLWERAGCPHGRSEAFWLQAEADLVVEAAAAPAPSPKKSATRRRVGGVAAKAVEPAAAAASSAGMLPS